MKGRENRVAERPHPKRGPPLRARLKAEMQDGAGETRAIWEIFARNASSLGSGLPVQAALRKLGQCAVGVVFLLKRLVEQRRRLFHAEVVGPGDQRPVTSDLVMLN